MHSSCRIIMNRTELGRSAPSSILQVARRSFCGRRGGRSNESTKFIARLGRKDIDPNVSACLQVQLRRPDRSASSDAESATHSTRAAGYDSNSRSSAVRFARKSARAHRLLPGGGFRKGIGFGRAKSMPVSMRTGDGRPCTIHTHTLELEQSPSMGGLS